MNFSFSSSKLFSHSTLIILLSAFSASTKAIPEYKAYLNESRGTIRVNACFEEGFTGRLTTGRSKDYRYLDSFLQGTKQVRANGKYISLRKGHPSCVNYVVNLNKAKENRQAMHVEGGWLVDNRVWLWRPTHQDGIKLSFIHEDSKENSELSVPWSTLNNLDVYGAGKTPVGWSSKMAFGNVKRFDVPVNGQHVRIGMLGISNQAKAQELRDWIQHGAQAIASVSGNFPIDNAQILVMPIGRRSEPVPWAEVQRAGLPSVHLYIDPERPIKEFYADWTLTHELSHLLIPRVSGSARWVSEGIASYYQNVLMARAQMQSPDTSWKKLKAGFAKGRRAAKNTSVINARKTKHVYWGGAALMYMADVDLRLRDKGNSLDDVLIKLQNCCIPSTDYWQADDFMEKLDELSGTHVFTDLLNNEARQSRFPIDRGFEKTYNPIEKNELRNILTPIQGLQGDY